MYNMAKTNALRMLDQAKIPYILHTYADTTDGEEVARRVGLNPEKVFKTLVTVANTKEHFVFMVPVCNELDLKKAAKTAGVKEIKMIKQAELLPLTGYVHGGCSPIGMKKSLRTFIDETAKSHDKIACSAGKIGMQIEIELNNLSKLVKFELGNFRTDK